jgi:F0F1-type ATP synthase membrane subunit b/b'
MFTSGQLNEFQNRFQEVLQTAQARATARAKEFESEARKLLDLVGDRAQVELKSFLSGARSDTRDSVAHLGLEIEKLGKRLQEIARAATEPLPNGKDEAASSGFQPPSA